MVGGVIRTVGHRAGSVAAIGYQRMRSHQVVIGTTGTGKTTLLLRLWTGFMATGLRRHAAGLGPPPLLVVLDCKGGSDARRIADRTRRVLREAGARSTAVWPDEASLSLWSLPPRQLTTTLVDLIEHGTGAAAYYTDVMEALIGLAVEAPCGPPASSQDLLDRLEPGWLSAAYAGSGTSADHAMIRSAARHLGEVALRFRTLFRRLGGGLDGTGDFADADAWYCILEGTDQISVAEGAGPGAGRPAGQLRGARVREVPGRTAGARSCWPSMSSAPCPGGCRSGSFTSGPGRSGWPCRCRRSRGKGSARRPTSGVESRRPPKAGSGCFGRLSPSRSRLWPGRGRWSRRPGGLAGSRSGPIRGRLGCADVPVVDASLIRGLDVGQVAYLYRGGVTYVQVKRLVASPAAVERGAEVGAPVDWLERPW